KGSAEFTGPVASQPLPITGQVLQVGSDDLPSFPAGTGHHRGVPAPGHGRQHGATGECFVVGVGEHTQRAGTLRRACLVTGRVTGCRGILRRGLAHATPPVTSGGPGRPLTRGGPGRLPCSVRYCPGSPY